MHLRYAPQTYLVRVHACAWSVWQWWDVEGVRNQVLLGIHQVLQFFLIQEALEKLAVIGAGQLHAVITLTKAIYAKAYVITIILHYNSWALHRDCYKYYN